MISREKDTWVYRLEHKIREAHGPDYDVINGGVGGYIFGTSVKQRLLQLERMTPVLEGCTSTHILCRVGCPQLRRAKPANRVVFASVEDARSVGYRPCRVCRPSQAA